MITLNNDIIFNTIDNGIIILDENLTILAWNRWLELRTNLKEDDIINQNICKKFPYINEKKLKRKIKAVLITQTPSYYNVDPHQYLIDIKLSSIFEKIYDSMQQDVTIVPYDLEKKQVCLYIYDKTSLCKINFKLKELSNRDPMTESYNRRYFGEISKKMLSLSLRNQLPISLVILDIDQFKGINDCYGHDIGDKVIILLSNTLEKFIRQSDVSARFGGEEFVLLLYDTDLNNAYKIANKIRCFVETLYVRSSENMVKFTVSMGVAQYNDKKDIYGIENTIKRADDALYLAKKRGRNQVVKDQ